MLTKGDLAQIKSVVQGETKRLSAKIVNLDSKVSRLDSRVANLDSKVVSLDSRVASLDSKVVSLDSRVASLDSKIARLDSRLAQFQIETRKNFVRLEKKMNYADRFLDKEIIADRKRITRIEAHLNLKPLSA